jgi:ABC transporter fused permease/ATP-binding protein
VWTLHTVNSPIGQLKRFNKFRQNQQRMQQQEENNDHAMMNESKIGDEEQQQHQSIDIDLEEEQDANRSKSSAESTEQQQQPQQPQERPSLPVILKKLYTQFSSRQFLWLIGLAKPEIGLLIIGTISLVVSSGINLVLPNYIGTLVDTVLKADDGQAYLRRVIVVMLGLAVVMAITTFIRSLCFNLAGERVVARLRKHLFSAIIGQEVAFFDETKTGELLNRLASDTKSLENAVTVNISMLLRYAVQIIGCIGILFYTSWKLCLVMLSLVPPLVLGAVMYGMYVRSLSKAVQDALAKSSDVAEESLSNIRTVRSFGKESQHRETYASAIDESYRLAKKLAFANGIFGTVMIVAGNLAVVLVIWYGSNLVMRKELTVGVLTSFLIYTLMVAMALGVLSAVFFDVYKALGATERVYHLVKRVAKIERLDHTKPNGVELSESQINGHVKFNNVQFTYPTRPDNKVLRGLTLDIQPGKVVALVGESGAGKSSCVSLIQRFYDPNDGTITLDGVPLDEFDTLFLRNHIGVVSQEPTLFACSVSDNIVYGCPEYRKPTQSEIIEAAKQANAHNFIVEFKEGYDTKVGERGVRLSGGQKQRIAIARAILKQPRVLLLDEATSALDAESEFLVQQALDRLMQNRTTLVVAHRLSTVKNADMVCVVSKGQIVESGTHAELLERGGAYKNLVDRQLLQSGSGSVGTDDTMATETKSQNLLD